MVFTPTLKYLNELRWHLVFHLDKICETKILTLWLFQ